MMLLSRHHVARFVGSLVAFIGLVVVVPAGLVAVSRAQFGSASPLSGVAAPWRWSGGDPGAAVSDPIADSTLIDALVRVSLCVAWVAVVIIVVTTVLEAIHLVRHEGIPRPDVRGLGWAQGIGRVIAAGLIVVLPLAAPTASLADSVNSPPTARTMPAAAPPVADVSTPADPSAEHPADDDPAEHVHVVRRGESVYSIAETIAAGAGVSTIDVANAIVDANLGRSMGGGERFTNPAYLEVGWELQIPAPYVNDHIPSVRPVATPPVEADPTTYVVQRGDTLWDVADAHLADPLQWREIWNLNAGRDMGNGRSFDDPALILPGWQLLLPGPPSSSPQPAQPAQPEVDAAPPVVDTDIGEPEQPLDEPVPPPSPAVDFWETDDDNADHPLPADAQDWPITVDAEQPAVPPVVDAAPAAEVPIRFDDMVASTDVAPSTTDAPIGHGGPGPSATTNGGAPTAPSPVRLEHAALLAAGVLALVAVHRRQRLRAARPRHRVPDPPPDVVDTERRLRAIDPGERALRVDVAVRAIACALRGSDAEIGWIEVSVDGGLEVRLTAPAMLPAPWITAGATWVLGADMPIELLADAARRVDMPCPALVQIGVTAAGGEVLLDVEACGTLSIEAATRQSDEIVAAIAAGLASSLDAEVAHLIAASLDASALLGHRNAHAVDSADAALDLAASLVGTTIGNPMSTFTLRSLHTGGEAWEPAIVFLRTSDVADVADLGRLCPPAGHGLGVVVACDRSTGVDAGARLIAEPDGWRLEAFGGTVDLTPVGLTVDDLRAIEAVLADAQRPLEPIELAAAAEVRWASDELDPDDGTSPTEPNESVGDSVDTEVDPFDDLPFVERPHEIVVGVLGGVTVTDRTGTAGSFERSKTIELIAWLTTHRERATRSRARTALWDMDVRDATFANVVSEARRALARLVTPPDGEEWVARTLTDQLPVHDLLVTDAELVADRVDHARLQPPAAAMETLRPAVTMVREMPFAGTAYLWPDAEGITSNLVLLAMTATTDFAGHALSLGDTDGVFWATARGLQVLPGHEELIALRMRAHARSGDLAGVRQEWESYERVLNADAWSDGEPAPKLVALRHELLST